MKKRIKTPEMPCRIPIKGKAGIFFKPNPTKIVLVGLNYADHARELGMDIPEEPVIFLKPPSSVICEGGCIEYPEGVRRLDYEGELAVVIGKTARAVRPRDADAYIAGYTCLNDVTARDIQSRDGQWTRAKSFDTFCPVGPHLVADIDTSHLDIRTSVNGVVKQESNTRNLIFPVRRIVAFVSRVMTLFPGDIISTGTPPGVGPLSVGDRVCVEIEGIGCLCNNVVYSKTRKGM